MVTSEYRFPKYIFRQRPSEAMDLSALDEICRKAVYFPKSFVLPEGGMGIPAPKKYIRYVLQPDYKQISSEGVL